MKKPQGFFHIEREEVTTYDSVEVRRTYHLGRFQVSGFGLFLVVALIAIAGMVAQIILLFVFKGESPVTWPALVYFGMVGLYVFGWVLYGLFRLFRVIAGEFKINGPKG